MTPTFTLVDAEFREAVRQALATSNRELSDAVNSRMFFLSLKAFKNMKPLNRKMAQQAVRQYLRQTPSKIPNLNKLKAKGSKRLTLAHLIVQKKQKEKGQRGLYGQQMTDATRKWVRARIARVGFLRSVWAGVQKRFNKYAKGKNPDGRKHKSILERHRLAMPGINPVATMDSSVPIAANQGTKVGAEFQAGLAKAMASEIIEMRQKVQEKMQAISDRHRGR